MAKTPSYRKRKDSTQAIVTLTDSGTGKRRDYWLGEFGTPQSRESYHRLIAEWEAGARRFPDRADERARAAPNDSGPTVGVIALAYWRWASANHRAKRASNVKVALRLLRKLDGTTPATAYGPKRLRLLREAMVLGDAASDPPRRPWSRRTINDRVQVITAMFRWAASQEMIPAEVPQALAMVEALKRGRTSAREGDPVGPVPLAMVDAVRPLVSRQVRAIIDLQLLTGARPGELLGLRPIDIDTSGPHGLWAFTPREHKNAFRGVARKIFFGPRAQEVLGPLLAGRATSARLFSPAEAESERRAAMHAARATPLGYGNAPGTNRSAEPARPAGACYTTESYRRSIERACDAAFPPPQPLARREGETDQQWGGRLTPSQARELRVWRRAHRWRPHQLRHNAATYIRREFGLEAAQLVLGHSSAMITDAVYAERDQSKVADVIRRVG